MKLEIRFGRRALRVALAGVSPALCSVVYTNLHFAQGPIYKDIERRKLIKEGTCRLVVVLTQKNGVSADDPVSFRFAGFLLEVTSEANRRIVKSSNLTDSVAGIILESASCTNVGLEHRLVGYC